MTDSRIALSALLGHAADAVGAVRAGESLTSALARCPAPARPGAQALAFHALRFLGAAEVVRGRLVAKAPPAAVDALLLTSLALLWPPGDPPYPSHTLVDQAVECAHQRTPRHAAFVNAVLRRFGRDSEAHVRIALADPLARFNHRPWWLARLQADWPDCWQAIADADNVRAPMTLRVNARRTTVAAYLDRLAAHGIAAQALGDTGVAGALGASAADVVASGLAASSLGASGPGASGLGASGPGASGPGASGPGASGPGASGPGASGPGASGLGASGPGASGLGASGPGASGLGASGPGASGPGASGLDASGLGSSAIVLERPMPVDALPGFAAGKVSVQDEAAQLAAPLLLGRALASGARVLDACAAPGGKTAHLLELADLDVLAIDRDPARLVRVDETLARLGLRATTLAADAGDPEQWWDGRPFDAILLDAPCTASGIVRRHPDIRWLRRAGDVDALAAGQARLLDALWPLLAPGGRLLYCTCSVFQREGGEQIDAFLQRRRDAVVAASPPSPGQLLSLRDNRKAPQAMGRKVAADGFFLTLLEKLSAPRREPPLAHDPAAARLTSEPPQRAPRARRARRSGDAPHAWRGLRRRAGRRHR